MPVEISAAPTVVENPAFAGLTVAVPLSEEPSAVWLDLLALHELPGKGHRLRGATLEFHLDRDSHDVLEAMRLIVEAIGATNTKYAVDGGQLEAGRQKETLISEDARRKISRILEDWWAKAGKTMAHPDSRDGPHEELAPPQ